MIVFDYDFAEILIKLHHVLMIVYAYDSSEILIKLRYILFDISK